MITKAQALKALRPTAEWVWVNEDQNGYAGLDWLDENQTKPTETEINTKQIELQAAEDQAIIDKENNKSSAKAKLAALGLTEAEIKDTFGL